MADRFPSRRQFHGWLCGLGLRDAGYPNESNACPLAMYLREHGHAGAIVGATKWHSAWVGRRRLPAWARAFVVAVDDGPHYKIRADQAVDVLGTVS